MVNDAPLRLTSHPPPEQHQVPNEDMALNDALPCSGVCRAYIGGVYGVFRGVLGVYMDVNYMYNGRTEVHIGDKRCIKGIL